LPKRRWPEWWGWELEFHPHLFKRMVDREFTEVDLRRMLQHATDYRRDIVPGRWVVLARHRRQPWHVIVEPDFDAELLVVVTAYPPYVE
jgi:uncharacterized protein DUF4258